jgi:ankyrin repeat protein
MRPSLEYLKKLAKERLIELRRTDPKAQLAKAQLAIAREQGFPSWRALKADVERRRAAGAEEFLAAAEAGDVATLRAMLESEPGFARVRFRGTTALHRAVPHLDALRLLLEHGADPNAREEGDNATPLHVAAGHGSIDAVRMLLDAGADPQGQGDLHHMDVIGWATCFAEARRDVVALLLERGAHHTIFSAIAMNDPGLVRRVVRHNPGELTRRLSQFEQRQTPLHYVVAPADGLVGGLFRTGEHYRTLDVLLELGADLEATDDQGRTPMAMAMLRGDTKAMRRLQTAGARMPASPTSPSANLSDPATSVSRLTPMLGVPDIDATIAWYQAVGFEVMDSHGEGGRIDFAYLGLGNAHIMFVPSGDTWRGATSGLSLWLYTNRIDDLYAGLKLRQLERARAVLAGESTDIPELKFTADLYTAFYGMREFGIRDPNGVELMFAQPAK